MRKIFIVVFCILLSGCAGPLGLGSDEKRVRTLGVLPVLVDAETIEHSSWDGLAEVLEQGSSDVDDWLAQFLREEGGYFDVRLIEYPANQLLKEIVASRTLVGEGEAAQNVYTFNPEAINRLTKDNLVDAVLVVILNGVKREEKRWIRRTISLEFLKANYRSVLYAAAVVAPPSEQLWVWQTPPGEVFLRLDYPDFTEAQWNKTEEVRIKEITLFGLDRTLSELEDGLITPKKYNKMVRELVRELENGL
jgi:hypothetical protein